MISHPDYDKQVSLQMIQLPLLSASPRSAQISVTAAYLGATPATWELEVPDLTAAAFDATWSPLAGAQTTWTVFAYGFDDDLSLLAPYDGLAVLYAIRAGSIVP